MKNLIIHPITQTHMYYELYLSNPYMDIELKDPILRITSEYGCYKNETNSPSQYENFRIDLSSTSELMIEYV